MKRQWHIFLTAVMFYTRIPCPSWVDHSADTLNKATRYLPLIGWVVGGFAAGIFYLAQLIFPLSIAILFSMISSIWLTGAFHEDGFADVCDGFWGGWTKEQKLNIMKDSRLGTYGAAGILMLLLTKFFMLSSIASQQLPLIIITGHVLSRLTPVLVIFSLDYVREDAQSKAKPVSKQIKVTDVLVAFCLAVASLSFYGYSMLLIIPGVFIINWGLGRYFVKQLGGYTGDCLGASQQLSEVFIYILTYLIWQYM